MLPSAEATPVGDLTVQRSACEEPVVGGWREVLVKNFFSTTGDDSAPSLTVHGTQRTSLLATWNF